MLRAVASQHCGPGSVPGLCIICGLSLLLVLVFAPRGFSLDTPVFPSPQKRVSEFQFDLDTEGHRVISESCHALPSLNNILFTLLLLYSIIYLSHSQITLFLLIS